MNISRSRSGIPAAAAYRGFTLIELIVILVVIGVLVALALPRLGWIRQQTPLEKETRDIVSVVELARDEAALQGRNFGLRFYPNGFSVLELEPVSGAWITIEDDDLLVDREFSDRLTPLLIIEERVIELEQRQYDQDNDEEPETDIFGQPIATAGEQPHVAILASGEVTPFVLELDEIGEDGFVRIESDFLGNLAVSNERVQ